MNLIHTTAKWNAHNNGIEGAKVPSNIKERKENITMITITSSEHFNTGAFVFTPMINYTTETNAQFAKELTKALSRYTNKDWGEICREDKAVNDEALKFPDNLYLLGAYETCEGRVYIITNRISGTAGDNCTTVLFADEY